MPPCGSVEGMPNLEETLELNMLDGLHFPSALGTEKGVWVIFLACCQKDSEADVLHICGTAHPSQYTKSWPHVENKYPQILHSKRLGEVENVMCRVKVNSGLPLTGYVWVQTLLLLSDKTHFSLIGQPQSIQLGSQMSKWDLRGPSFNLSNSYFLKNTAGCSPDWPVNRLTKSLTRLKRSTSRKANMAVSKKKREKDGSIASTLQCSTFEK